MSKEIWSNDSEWKKSSDDWVKTMEESAKNKELFLYFFSRFIKLNIPNNSRANNGIS